MSETPRFADALREIFLGGDLKYPELDNRYNDLFNAAAALERRVETLEMHSARDVLNAYADTQRRVEEDAENVCTCGDRFDDHGWEGLNCEIMGCICTKFVRKIAPELPSKRWTGCWCLHSHTIEECLKRHCHEPEWAEPVNGWTCNRGERGCYAIHKGETEHVYQPPPAPAQTGDVQYRCQCSHPDGRHFRRVWVCNDCPFDRPCLTFRHQRQHRDPEGMGWFDCYNERCPATEHKNALADPHHTPTQTGEGEKNEITLHRNPLLKDLNERWKECVDGATCKQKHHLTVIPASDAAAERKALEDHLLRLATELQQAEDGLKQADQRFDSDKKARRILNEGLQAHREALERSEAKLGQAEAKLARVVEAPPPGYHYKLEKD